jgi:hypothetical protein
VFGDLTGHDVSVIALRSGYEGVGAFNSRSLEHFLINSITENGGALEIWPKAAKRGRFDVHDRHFVPSFGQHQGDARPDAPASHDDDEHRCG